MSESTLNLRLPVTTARLWSALVAHCAEGSDLHPDAESTEIVERDATTWYRRASGPGFAITERISIDERRHRLECEVIESASAAGAELRYRVMSGDDPREARLALRLIGPEDGDAILARLVQDLRRRVTV